MKPLPIHNGILTALFAVLFFCGGINPGDATTFTPTFTDCFLVTPSWDSGPEQRSSETGADIFCLYAPNLGPDDFRDGHHRNSYMAMDWQGYASLFEWKKVKIL